MKKYFFLLVFFLAASVEADDWGGDLAIIKQMYVYTNAVIVVQGSAYKGEANCEENNKWSFYWNELDPEVADRVYSALLAAYMSKTPIKPIFHSTQCGPENAKKFKGSFAFQ